MPTIVVDTTYNNYDYDYERTFKVEIYLFWCV